MVTPLPSTTTVCSTCGEPLNAKGECVACLLRRGLEKSSAFDTKPSAPLVFGDFEVARREDGFFWELGRGAFGVTYLAVDNVLRRRVALKVIDVPAAARGSHATRERFLREARAAAALRHPNVAAIYQFGTSPNGSRCFYAMELIQGETLETRVRRDGPLNSKLALDIAIQIASALIPAAAQGLIHRDLKPANIMLTSSNAETAQLEVKVIDFGLAKAIADAGGEMDLTHGEFVGTPTFASPEQFESGAVDVRSDIYSLGATLWFALTGKTPFAGRNIEEIHRAQKSDTLPIEQLDAARGPSSLKSLLVSMLAFEPAARPGIHELTTLLRRCSAKEITLEIGHVLFIDIVGYSKLSINDQRAAVDELTQTVRSTEEFREAEASDRLIKIATGDGMALVFYTSPEAPVRCAMQISRVLKHHPGLHIRMGIHSGAVSGLLDVTGRANLTGAGLNVAQRVMDCGDAGHILLSKHVAEDLEQYEGWRPLLHDLGTIDVKHGIKLHIVNLYDADVGCRELPATLRMERRRVVRMRWVSGAAAIGFAAAILAGMIFVSRSRPPLAQTAPEKSVAVLPFENLSRDPDNAYFSDGIQGEILTKLAAVGDLKVISRSSTAKYKSKSEDLKTVARELGVANVLEGSVQKAGGKVRVNVQLLDARVDTHLWAKSYDRDLKDVFAVETEVAQEIADALRAKLSPSQTDALTTAPTHDTEAYDLFLKGEYEERQAESALTSALFDRAETFYRQALARDPNFALTYARLAYSQLSRHWFISNLTSAELAEVKSHIDRALAIAPALADAHLALAVFHYWGYRDYDAALRELDRVVELQPNNTNAQSFYAAIYRRRGEWEQSFAAGERAAELDPRDPQIPTNIGAACNSLRRWGDAEHALTHALALDPQNALAANFLARTYVNSAGDVRRAKQAYEGMPAESRTHQWLGQGVSTMMIDERVYLDVLERHFADALKAWDTLPMNAPEERLRQLEARVGIQLIAGQGELARSECEQARALLEARLAERPEDRTSMVALAWVYVCLGRNADAVGIAKQAADSLPVEKDALYGPVLLSALAEIEARTGHAEEAVKILRQLIIAPAGNVVSVARLKIDPVWDPIRNDPDFQKLISEPEPETVYK